MAIKLGKVKKKRFTRENFINNINSFRKSLKRRHLALLAIFIFIAVLVLNPLIGKISNFISPYYIQADDNTQKTFTLNNGDLGDSYQNSSQSTNATISSNELVIGTTDPRAYVLDQYFLANQSPLYGTGSTFIQKCDEYGAPRDCLTIVAIAEHETDLCKYANSAQMHNCWGFGGGGSARQSFANFNDAIDTVTRSLVYSYGVAYIKNPSLMEMTFCGPRPSCVGWGDRIKFFINKIDSFSQGLGFGSLLQKYG